MSERTQVPGPAAEGGTMTVRGHLRELRKRMVICGVVFAAAFVVCFYYAGTIISLLTEMGVQYGYHFVYIAPQELLMVYFNVAIICALLIDLPVIAMEIYRFTQPGLKPGEQKSLFWAMLFGGLCFIVGLLFAYKISVPFMLYFLINFSGDAVPVTASISIQQFLNFVMTVFVIFGCVFEMPVISALLAKLGFLKPEWMLKYRKYAIVVIFIIAAIITPPDVASQVLVALPMVLLYEISIGLTKTFYQERTEEAEEE
jgi:sec-independent protein translocase protein TatC